MSSTASPTDEVNIAQLFSDVTRALDGFKNLIIPPIEDAAAAAQHDATSLSGTFGRIFSGDACIKACGMEDIQKAAKKAGDLMVTLRHCTVVMTILVSLFLILLSIAILWYLFRKPNTERAIPSVSSSLSETSIYTQKHPRNHRSPTPSTDCFKK